MSVLPVIDLMGGAVVRGIAGQRATYKPIRSQIASDATPTSIAHGFATKLGFQDVYLADLDAIAGSQPAWQIYESIAEYGLNLVVDAGINDSQRAIQLREMADQHLWLHGVVVGLESVGAPSASRPPRKSSIPHWRSSASI